jgi:hypothetical protein
MCKVPQNVKNKKPLMSNDSQQSVKFYQLLMSNKDLEGGYYENSHSNPMLSALALTHWGFIPWIAPF